MLREGKVWLGQTAEGKPIFLLPQMANRHGLVAGATGTGKTFTLKVLAESFSELGVPVFLADVKGDLSGLIRAGEDNENMQERRRRFGLDEHGFTYQNYPTTFWDMYQEAGIPLRITVAEMGPLLLSRVLSLNEVQSGVMAVVFRVADDQGWLLLDLDDLRMMLTYCGEHAAELKLRYGNISPSTVGAIQRRLLQLEDQGADKFFGEPAIEIEDLMRTAPDGRGVISVLESEKLFQFPLLYSTFLLWFLSEMYETLPEVGDVDKPKLVFFFDEAHLLFDGASEELLTRINQVVKLIRSKGVGIYFVTQNPRDIPEDVLAQVGNRIQHRLNAYTPAEMRAVQAAADSFRVNPAFATSEVITQLETGEALVSCLTEDGTPAIVERCFILPPRSHFGIIERTAWLQHIAQDTLYDQYAEEVNRESAYEILTAKVSKHQELMVQQEDELAATQTAEEEMKAAKLRQQMDIAEQREADRQADRLRKLEEQEAKEAEKERKEKFSWITRMTNSAVSSVGRELGRSLTRGVLGGFKR